MKWSILIATHVSRRNQFLQLVDQLAPQLTPDIQVDVLWNRGSAGIGEYRQVLLDTAVGEYTCFVDDDDRLPDYYTTEILTAFESDPDYVGFPIQLHDNSDNPVLGVRDIQAFHSIRYDGWYGRPPTLFRDVTHLNPIRRALALKGTFEGGRSEDHKWAKQVRPWVKTEAYIPKTMYFYEFDKHKSIPQNKHDRRRINPPDLPEGFTYHPKSDA